MSNEQKNNNFYLILILGLLTAIRPFSIDMYLPAFPAIAKGLHTTVAQVTLSLSSFFIGISFGQLLYGQALGGCVGMVAARAMVRDLFEVKEMRKYFPCSCWWWSQRFIALDFIFHLNQKSWLQINYS
jgi:DHA1 family bicyclomycin/chloramphenicol resistance-like MFS transporter